MKTATLIFAAALGCAVIGPQAASSQPAGAASAGQVDPRAVQALTKMSAYLRSIPAFQIDLKTQRDDVDASGQLITLSGGGTYKVKRPNAFDIDLQLPNETGRFVYDGKTVTVYDARQAVYAKFQAPATIRDTLELAKTKYGAQVPLEDLFTWSEGDAAAKGVTSAHFVGRAQIDGQMASHYAFRQTGVDWQVWIADGSQPTPLRVVIVPTQDPARPQFRADLRWNTTPEFAPDVFSFTAPANAREVSR